MSQYFDNDENIVSSPVEAYCWVGSQKLSFTTDNGVFSKGEIDEASLCLVQNISGLKGRVLDLGCGYGFIGIYLKRKFPDIDLVQSDVNRRALALCAENCRKNGVESEIAESDGFASLDGPFDAVVLNPPIHAGKEVVYRLYDESVNNLTADGRLYIVIQKKHGAASSIKYLEDKGLKVTELFRKKGMYVLSIGNVS